MIVVARSRVRVSRLLGVPLLPKVEWYLRRNRRPPARRGGPGRDHGEYRLGRRVERLLREQYHFRGPQLRRACAEAVRGTGDTADHLVQLLERRLDALVWRAGFAPSIHRARRLIERNHFTVDGQDVDLPSYRVEPGQTVELRPAKADKVVFAVSAYQGAVEEPSPPYLDVQAEPPRATLTRAPRRDEVPVLADEDLAIAVHQP
jgi:small subunit ribosomal protein S4